MTDTADRPIETLDDAELAAELRRLLDLDVMPDDPRLVAGRNEAKRRGWY